MKKLLFIIFTLLVSCIVSAQDSTYHRAVTWEKTMRKFNEKDKISPPSSDKLILFIGSSSFTRWDNIEDYFSGYNVINRGFGGSIAADLIYYAEDIVFPYKPSQIVIYEGDNDIGSGMPVCEYMTDMKTLLRLIEIRLPGVPVIVLSIKGSPRRDISRTKYEEANVKMYEYTQSKRYITFLDVYSSLLDNMGNYRNELFAEDSLHINKDAYKLWADIIRPHLIK